MKKGFSVLFMVLGVVFGGSEVLFAGEDVREIAELRSRLAALEEKYARNEEEGIRSLKSREEAEKIFSGLNVAGGVTMVVQGVRNANGDGQSSGKEDVTDASYSVDLEFGKEFEQGEAFVHLEAGDGAGVDEELKLFSSVNRDADDSDNAVAVTEAWYEHKFGQGPFRLAFGKLDAASVIDDNAYANDEGAQFLGSMFRNSAVIEFPDNAPGIRALYAFGGNAEAAFTAVDGAGDGEDVADSMFYGGQINFKPGLRGREGNYRFILWSNGDRHTRWDNIASDKENSWGYGLSFDQELNDVFGVFIRYGWQDPEVVSSQEDDFDIATAFGVEQAYSLGMQLKGALWGRAQDVSGLALGQIFVSDEYKRQDVRRKGRPETYLEWYYNWQVNEYLHLSPDLQIVQNPYGGDALNGKDTVVVAGVRAQVSF